MRHHRQRRDGPARACRTRWRTCAASGGGTYRSCSMVSSYLLQASVGADCHSSDLLFEVFNQVMTRRSVLAMIYLERFSGLLIGLRLSAAGALTGGISRAPETAG